MAMVRAAPRFTRGWAVESVIPRRRARRARAGRPGAAVRPGRAGRAPRGRASARAHHDHARRPRHPLRRTARLRPRPRHPLRARGAAATPGASRANSCGRRGSSPPCGVGPRHRPVDLRRQPRLLRQRVRPAPAGCGGPSPRREPRPAPPRRGPPAPLARRALGPAAGGAQGGRARALRHAAPGGAARTVPLSRASTSTGWAASPARPGHHRRQPPQLLRRGGAGHRGRPPREARALPGQARALRRTRRRPGGDGPWGGYRWTAASGPTRRCATPVGRSRRARSSWSCPRGRSRSGKKFFETELKGKTGTARLAAMTGAPVYPIGLWGTEAVWPRSARVPDVGNLLHPPTVRVRVGKPVHLGLDDAVADTEAIMAAIMTQLPAESQRPARADRTGAGAHLSARSRRHVSHHPPARRCRCGLGWRVGRRRR